MRRVSTLAVLLAVAVVSCAPPNGQVSQDGSHKERSADGSIEGDVVGYAVPGSTFSRLHIGMSQRQAQDIVGPESDSDGHITGKQFIPFYFGGDQYRTVSYYKGQGRLEFAPRSIGSTANTLMKIVNDRTESGYSH